VLTVVDADGMTSNGSLIDEAVREGARRMLAAALEAEVDSYLADLAGHRDECGRRLVVRNGHHAERTMATSAGPVKAKAPRVNDKRIEEASGSRRRFASAILPPSPCSRWSAASWLGGTAACCPRGEGRGDNRSLS
jgi:putative transposase